ncbi:MAG: hypothetical protein IPM29_04485 [Planctomycetes bacterium]|nr:hypothetical protein [Planctomycetota bacterium]
MNSEPTIRIDPRATALVGDLETALDHVLGRAVIRGPAALLGQDALVLESEDDGRSLLVRRLVARGASGRLHVADRVHVPLPAVVDGESIDVRLGLGWQAMPVSDGSAVSCGESTVRLLADGEGDEDGELVVGVLSASGFDAVPVPADRLDATEADERWRRDALSQVRALDDLLLRLAARVDRLRAPILTWNSLLLPLQLAVAQAMRDLAPDRDPEAALGALGMCCDAAADLEHRAAALRDAQLLALIRCVEPAQLHHEMPRAEPFHARCTAALHRVELLAAAIEALLRGVGGDPTRLPDRLYHDGRVFDRLGVAELAPIGAGPSGTTRIYRLAGAPRHGAVHLALRWRGAARVMLGDVRTFVGAPRDGARRRDERFLGSLERDGFHWLADVAPGATHIEAPDGLELDDAALYTPWAGGPLDGPHPEKRDPR